MNVSINVPRNESVNHPTNDQPINQTIARAACWLVFPLSSHLAYRPNLIKTIQRMNHATNEDISEQRLAE